MAQNTKYPNRYGSKHQRHPISLEYVWSQKAHTQGYGDNHQHAADDVCPVENRVPARSSTWHPDRPLSLLYRSQLLDDNPWLLSAVLRFYRTLSSLPIPRSKPRSDAPETRINFAPPHDRLRTSKVDYTLSIEPYPT